jgi:hypothetical protein
MKNKAEILTMRRRGTGRNVMAILVATVFWNVVVSRLCTGDEAYAAFAPAAFGAEFPELDGWATGEWWKKRPTQQPFSLDVPRQDVIAFAIYTVTAPPVTEVKDAQRDATLKLSAQLFPLKPGEPLEARLEIRQGDAWVEVARAPVLYPGWDAHFRVRPWDTSCDHTYRVRHGDAALFEGLIRKDPIDKKEITVAVLSCNSAQTPGPRNEIVAGLQAADPDLLFFAGDQSYRHEQHTYAWIEFGLQFRDVIRDRPTVTLPDDHDIGHPNLWGAGGKRALRTDGADGGYFFPAAYVNMVQRQQTWHLPDPVDPAPVEQGIGVYFTRFVLGGVDFAIIEDRKFKTGPAGKIPQLGPRPDHIDDPSYDRKAIDLSDLELLGDRQISWLRGWAEEWQGIRAKCALSQTAFCGAVHLHGTPGNRLLADLDCNGWPQSKRNDALRILKQARAAHLCGDQHLAAVVKHGIDAYGDGPWSFAGPAIVNTIYGRWWHPLDEKSGTNPVPGSPLPWTGDYEDGLGNKISMIAYANPDDVKDEKQRGDGYGIARFDFADQSAGEGGTLTFECWPRFPRLGANGRPTQYLGWPVHVPIR